jgi:6-phosphogluconolactonase
MELRIRPDAHAAAHAAAHWLAHAVRQALRARAPFHLALSGGRTPRPMLEALAAEPLDWRHIHVWQVDERFAPAGSEARNWNAIEAGLVQRACLPPTNVHPMPVDASGPDEACTAYATALRAHTGTPAVLDAVHLGLGADGHTASLFAEDPAFAATDADVAATEEHAGWRRLTLTLPLLSRARRVLWLVTGADKADALARLQRGDPAIVGSRVAREHAVAFVDGAAAGVETGR